jgi:hypothetical protein
MANIKIGIQKLAGFHKTDETTSAHGIHRQTFEDNYIKWSFKLSVTDENNAFVANLKPSDFKVNFLKDSGGLLEVCHESQDPLLRNIQHPMRISLFGHFFILGIWQLISKIIDDARGGSTFQPFPADWLEVRIESPTVHVISAFNLH